MPTDQETIEIEKIVCHSQFPREGTPSTPHSVTPGQATPGGTRVDQQAQERKSAHGPFCAFPGKEQVRQGQEALDWLV